MSAPETRGNLLLRAWLFRVGIWVEIFGHHKLLSLLQGSEFLPCTWLPVRGEPGPWGPAVCPCGGINPESLLSVAGVLALSPVTYFCRRLECEES